MLFLPVLPTLVGRWKSWANGPFGFRLDAVPLFAAFAVGQFIGFLVPEEDFLLGIPGQFATKFVSDVAQLAEAGGSMPGFNMGHGYFARVNAIDPVIMVVLGLVKLDCGLVVFKETHGGGFPRAAVD